MDSFKSYLLRDLYRDIEKLGDRLAEVEPLIDWEAFRPIISGLYSNQGPGGGRPNIDPVVMVKMLVPLVEQAGKHCRVQKALANGAYDSRLNFAYLEEKGIEAGIRVRRNSSRRARGCPA